MFKFQCMRKTKSKINNNSSISIENEAEHGIHNYNEVSVFTVDRHGKNFFSLCFKRNKKCLNSYVLNEPEYDELSDNIGINRNTYAKRDKENNTIDIGVNPCHSKEINLHPESLAEKLFHLSKYGWYWGPLTQQEANEKLRDEADGSFLVRDSSCDQYVLTLSFKSHGNTFHAHIDHIGGKFSIESSASFDTVDDLIQHSMKNSLLAFRRNPFRRNADNVIFLKLAQPISRFTQVRPLQYLCRFVIRQYVRADVIPKLPLPQPIMEYIEERQF